jgi:hypothetical protein
VRRLTIFAFATLTSACVDTGIESVSFPIAVLGTPVSGELTAVGGVAVVLESAQLAFGPVYFCAGYDAGYCDTARAEWLGSVVVDALDPTARTVGTATGVSGLIRSWAFDYGYSSALSRHEPIALDAARALGDVSLRLVGRATVDGAIVPFSFALKVAQLSQVEHGQPIVRTKGGAIDHDLVAEDQMLRIQFDPSPWVAGIDFRALRIGDEQAVRHLKQVLQSGDRPQLFWDEYPLPLSETSK